MFGHITSLIVPLSFHHGNNSTDLSNKLSFAIVFHMGKSSQKKLIRPKKGRVLGGVCLALANYFNLNVTLVRLLWIVLLLPGGLPGLLPYVILWVIIPDEK